MECRETPGASGQKEVYCSTMTPRCLNRMPRRGKEVCVYLENGHVCPYPKEDCKCKKVEDTENETKSV